MADLSERIPLTGQSKEDALFRLFRGACRVFAGREAELWTGDEVAVESIDDPSVLCWAGELMQCIGNLDRARRLNGKAVSYARRLGAAGVLVWALDSSVALAFSSDRLVTARTSAEEGYRLAEDLGYPNLRCRYQSSLALLAAMQGEMRTARDLADDVLSQAVPRGLMSAGVTAKRALGMVDLVAGRPDLALANLQLPVDSGNPRIILPIVPDLVEAAVKARQPAVALRSFAKFTQWAEAAHSPALAALAARCRALLAATPAAAVAEFRHAIELHTGGDHPIEHARTQLLFGEYLRRQRRRAEARQPLRTALEIFQAHDVKGWAARANAELHSAGGTAETTVSRGILKLTPQEVRIVDAVTAGATNSEVAAQLCLGPTTIDHHLRRIFDKVGANSRAELIRKMLTGGSEDSLT
ncbi:hypothetical protein NWFMUON74_40230 [Nocardia wallacei]|uniref:HTH luxR-type domain-containing protein n=2 Tax=Nocardia wallacei TaxID=480035 RepID=A0A7G1KN41_9NOCA|nr:hypothetical protein NWFMUON74_40230 [Nocardia wallacei]